MTKREAKAVEITRNMKNWNTGTDAMIMETPTFRCIVEAMEWQAEECAKEACIEYSDDDFGLPSIVESSILNAGKDEL